MNVDFLKKCLALSIEEPVAQKITVELEYTIQATLRLNHKVQVPVDYSKKDIDSAVSEMLDDLRWCDSDSASSTLGKPIGFDKLEAPKKIDIFEE